MINLLLFGPPGSGKGTQSVKLAEKYDLIHLSTGDMLRAEINAGTPLGEKVKGIIASGDLVPDSVVIEMIGNRIDAAHDKTGFIYDGFPRTVQQAIALESLLAKKNLSVTKMIALEVSHEELVRRLLGRGEISGRADDANEEVINTRIDVYREKTEPIIGHCTAQGKYFPVDGMGSVEEIFERLSKEIDEVLI